MSASDTALDQGDTYNPPQKVNRINALVMQVARILSDLGTMAIGLVGASNFP